MGVRRKSTTAGVSKAAGSKPARRARNKRVKRRAMVRQGITPPPEPHPVVGTEALTVARPRNEVATINFVEAIGGEEELISLLHQQDDPRAAVFEGLMADPAFSSMSLAQKRIKAGVTIQDLVEMFRDSQKAKGLIHAARRMPKVLERLAKDAEGAEVPCYTCSGEGWLAVEVSDTEDEPVRVICPDCHTLGVTSIPVDKDARKLFAEITGLTSSSPLVAIQNNRNTTIYRGNHGAPTSISDILGSSDDSVIEGDLVSDPD